MSNQSITGTRVPTPPTADYVVVDEGGEFSYYPSSTAMLEDLEYVDEAACIVNRSGNTFRLVLDAAGNLHLGPSFGPVEEHWLRQSWTTAQHRNLRAHPLQRLYAGSREALLRGLFETLTLERGKAEASVPWTVYAKAETVHSATLREVDDLLKGVGSLKGINVQDPYGHFYRPVRHSAHAPFRLGTGFISYVEVPASMLFSSAATGAAPP
jgi:hypothetical protein